MEKLCKCLYILILFTASIVAICLHSANLKIKTLENTIVEKDKIIQEFRKG